MAHESDPGDEQSPESDYWRERYRVAREFGLDRSHSRSFASSATTMAALRDLIARGCPADVAERILAEL